MDRWTENLNDRWNNRQNCTIKEEWMASKTKIHRQMTDWLIELKDG